MNIHQLIYVLGTKYRNPNLIPYFKFLNESDHWSYEQLREYQLKRLQKLIKIAYDYSPYYRTIMDEKNIKPNDIKQLDDLSKFPILNKSTLIEQNDKIHTQCHFKKLIFSETSGTSGQVLKMYRNEEWDSENRAAQYRGYSWYGVKPWDRNGYFWGYNIDKTQQRKVKIMDQLVNRFRIFSYDEKDIIDFCKKLEKADYIEGYSSMIYEVAKVVNKLGLNDKIHLKMVKGTSEKIYPSYQSEVKKAFGQKMISEYGACESGLIAFECPCGNMHITMENVIIEEVEGSAIVTNLMSSSFPIIRYKLGDAVKLAPLDYKCPCGRNHPVILDVLGRIGKNIKGKTTAYPSLTFYYVFKNLTLNHSVTLSYQAIQNEIGKVILKIEQNSPNHEEVLRAELEKYFKTDIEFSIVWGAKLHTMDGKLKDFITTID